MKTEVRPIEVIKTEFTHVYIAEDGTEFSSRRDCLLHEYKIGSFSLRDFFESHLVNINLREFSNPEWINDFILINNEQEFKYLEDYFSVNGYDISYITNSREPGLYGAQHWDGGDSRDRVSIYNIEEMIDTLDDDLRELGYTIIKL